MSIPKHIKEHIQLGIPWAGGNIEYVDSHGAVGDGVTVDTDAIRNAIVAAGSYGTVVFSPGKTYLLDGDLNPNWDGTIRVGQTWTGYGAILKRKSLEGITSAVTGTLVAGNTSCTVADGSVFRKGMSISFHTGSVTGDNAVYDTVNHRITTIAGNVITFTPAVGTIYTNTGTSEVAGGSLANPTCFAVTKLISIPQTSNDTKIIGLKIDGNRAGNNVFVRWWHNIDIHSTGDRAMAKDCHIVDSPCEAVLLGGKGSKFIDCQIENCGGNGYHFGQSKECTVSHCRVVNANVSGPYALHQDGCLSLSDQVQDLTISDNYFEGGLYGIGAVGAVQNRNITITGNTFRNMITGWMQIQSGSTTQTTRAIGTGGIVTSANSDGTYTCTVTCAAHSITAANITLGAYRFLEIRNAVNAEYYFNGMHEILTAPTNTTLTFVINTPGVTPVASSSASATLVLFENDDSPENIVIEGNRADNCGILNIQNSTTFSSTLGPKNISIIGNVTSDCYCSINRAHNVTLRGNTWKYNRDASVAVGSRTVSVVEVLNSTEVSVDDNVEGGLYGVSVTGTNARNVKVSGVIRNSTKYGVFFNGTPTTAQNLSLIGAIISCDTDGAAYVDTNRWGAVCTEGGTIVSGCTIFANYGVATAYNGAAIVCGTGNPTVETVIVGNTIRVNQTANGGAAVVVLSAGASGLIRYDKNWVGPVTAATTGGATIAGTNVTIA